MTNTGRSILSTSIDSLKRATTLKKSGRRYRERQKDLGKLMMKRTSWNFVKNIASLWKNSSRPTKTHTSRPLSDDEYIIIIWKSNIFRALFSVVLVKGIPQVLALFLHHFQSLNFRFKFFQLWFVIAHQLLVGLCFQSRQNWFFQVRVSPHIFRLIWLLFFNLIFWGQNLLLEIRFRLFESGQIAESESLDFGSRFYQFAFSFESRSFFFGGKKVGILSEGFWLFTLPGFSFWLSHGERVVVVIVEMNLLFAVGGDLGVCPHVYIYCTTSKYIISISSNIYSSRSVCQAFSSELSISQSTSSTSRLYFGFTSHFCEEALRSPWGIPLDPSASPRTPSQLRGICRKKIHWHPSIFPL